MASRCPAKMRAMIFALAVCAFALVGCSTFQDPAPTPVYSSGLSTAGALARPAARPERAARSLPGPRQPWQTVDLLLTPREVVAPVGREVILLAGVRGTDDYLRTNERIEWMLEPCGVGQFVALDEGTWTDPFVGDFTNARKIDNTRAIATTSRKLIRLTRGTDDPADDVKVLRGQTWVTVTSPVEGVSRATAVAPDVYGWPSRKQTAVIHWVDAAWTFPPPAITAAGSSRVLTTTVSRQTDSSPRVGWIVRYRILDGPEAGFAPDGSKQVEVLTNASGQAAVEIHQSLPAAGTNQVGIEVVRPAGLGAPDREILVDSGCTLQTWSAPDLALRVSGPIHGAVGCTLTYCLNVSNPGDVPANNVSVSQTVPERFSYTGGSPIATVNGATLQWSLGTLAAGQVKTIEAGFQALRAGRVDIKAAAVADGGLHTTASTATEVGSSELSVQIFGPSSANVGEQVTFEVLVSNRGQTAATNLVITDDFAPGLSHAVATARIRRRLGSLGPGESQRVSVTFRVDSPGLLTHSVEVTGDGGVGDAARGEVMAVDPMGRAPATTGAPGSAAGEPWSSGPSGPPTPPTGSEPPTRSVAPPRETTGAVVPRTGALPGSLSVRITGQEDGVRVGNTVIFNFEITNTGGQPLTRVNVKPGVNTALLTPMDGTTEYMNEDRTGWLIDAIQPNQSIRLEYFCKCIAESPSTQVTLEATSFEGAAAMDRAPLEIRAAESHITSQGSLEVEVTAVPYLQTATVGEELKFRIRVSNKGGISDKQISLKVKVSEQMSLVHLGTRGPLTTDGLLRAHFEGSIVNFDLLKSLDPNDSVDYWVQLQATGPGMAKLEAELYSDNHPLGLAKEETVTVVGYP